MFDETLHNLINGLRRSNFVPFRSLFGLIFPGTNGQALVHNGTNWGAGTPAETLIPLSQLDPTGAVLGNVPTFDGTEWIAQTPVVNGPPNGSMLMAQTNPDPTKYLSANGDIFNADLWPDLGLPGNYEWVLGGDVSSSNMWSVAHNGSIFCAVCFDGTTATSTDGVTWVPATYIGINGGFRQVLGLNGSFYALAGSGSNIYVSSDNAVTWNPVPLGISGTWRVIGYNGSVIIVVAYGGTQCSTSPTGAVWTPRTLPASANWDGIACLSNGLILVTRGNSGTAALSNNNGVFFSTVELPANAGGYVAVTSDGTQFIAMEGTGADVVRSTDGTNWVTSPIGVIGASWNPKAALWDGANIWGVDYNGSTKSVYSPDGVNWTLKALPNASNWWSLAFGDGKLIVVSVGLNTAINNAGMIQLPAIAANNGWNTYLRAAS